MTKIEIIQGSILDFDGDVIVNPANSFLRHGGGLAKLIADAASGLPKGVIPIASPNAADWAWERQDKFTTIGHNWLDEQVAHPNIPAGDAGWTSAGNLPYRGIIHAVGPIWGGGRFMESDILELAHDSALRVAQEHGCTSVAFPAISCGIFGYPVERAATVALRSAAYGDDYDVDRIVFYLFEREHFDAYEEAAQACGVL